MERDALIARFDALRNSGVCSPTTRGLLDEAERLLRQEPEWEYGAGYLHDNGPTRRWHSIGGNAFAIREAAEYDVARFADPQVQLVRRQRPGAWERVEKEQGC